MKRLVVSGSCKAIDKNINYILTLCNQAGDIVRLVGIMCADREYNSIDGIPCVSSTFDDYDYIIPIKDELTLRKRLCIRIKWLLNDCIDFFLKIIFSIASKIKKKNWVKANNIIAEVYKEGEQHESKKIADNRIINMDVLCIPGFEFGRYIELRERGVSIISNSCWGGFAYNYVGIPMQSPFINMWMYPNDIIKLLNNIEYYLSQKLVVVDSGYDLGKKRWYPIVSLGDVRMAWNHCYNLKQFKISVRQFIRRSERVDFDRLLAFIYFEGAGSAQKCEKEIAAIPIKNKIGISYDYAGENIYVAKDYLKDKSRFGNDFFRYVNSTVERDKDFVIKPFDILKLLNLEDDYFRI